MHLVRDSSFVEAASAKQGQVWEALGQAGKTDLWCAEAEPKEMKCVD